MHLEDKKKKQKKGRNGPRQKLMGREMRDPQARGAALFSLRLGVGIRKKYIPTCNCRIWFKHVVIMALAFCVALKIIWGCVLL